MENHDIILIETAAHCSGDGVPALNEYLETARFHLQMISLKLSARLYADIAHEAHSIRDASVMLGATRLRDAAAAMEDLVQGADERDDVSIRSFYHYMQALFRDAEKALKDPRKVNTDVLLLKQPEVESIMG